MQEQKIKEIRKLAHSIDIRINLFEGFTPKKTDIYNGEILFWRYIVNIYGLFADCDRAQIKDKPCMMDLMNKYSLISKEEFKQIVQFWNDISNLRKWFCHNNDETLYYVQIRRENLTQYLDKIFLIASNKPKCIEQVHDKEWNMLTADIERRFEQYLLILEKGLKTWENSKYKNDLSEEWVELFSRTLFQDKELIQNIIVDIARYEQINQGLNNTITRLAKVLSAQLEESGYSALQIKNVLCDGSNKIRSNREIVYESLRQILM